MYQYREVFIYMTILIAGYTFVGVWLGAISNTHKLFPFGKKDDDSSTLILTEHHWVDAFFAGVPFFIIGVFMGSFEWITK
jgi:hypothetical protein